MKKLFCLFILAFGLTIVARGDDDAYFFKRADLLDYASEQQWTYKSPSSIRDDAKLYEPFVMGDIKATMSGKTIKPVRLIVATNPLTMYMFINVGYDNDNRYELLLNASKDCIVYAYELSEMREVSLAAVEADGTKRWISIPNPDFEGSNATHFVVHRPMSLPEDEPLVLYLTHDQFVAITDYLAQLGDLNFVNAMPYAPD